MDPFAHTLEGAAATDVGDLRINVCIGGVRCCIQHARDRHDHAWLTIATLGRIKLCPGFLDGVVTLLR